jgi:hypothetical protein
MDGVVPHGIDLAAALQLDVLEYGWSKSVPDDGASVEGILVPPVALPPGVRHHHGKADNGSSQFLVNDDNVLVLGGGRGHGNGRVMEKRKWQEVVSHGCDVFLN